MGRFDREAEGWDDDDADAFERPQDDDLDDPADDQADTAPCPNCQREIVEGLERCPLCGEWITWRARQPRLVIIVALLLLLALALLTFGW